MPQNLSSHDAPLSERGSGIRCGRLAAVLFLGLVIGLVFGAVGSVNYVPTAKSKVASPFDQQLDGLQHAARIALPSSGAEARSARAPGRGDFYAAAAHRRRNQPGRADWNRQLREARLDHARDRVGR